MCIVRVKRAVQPATGASHVNLQKHWLMGLDRHFVLNSVQFVPWMHLLQRFRYRSVKGI